MVVTPPQNSYFVNFFSALIKFTFCDLFFTLSRCRPLTSEWLNPASLFVPCKGIQDSPELWIASYRFRILGAGFQFLLACVAWRFCRAARTSGKAARKTKTSWFLCPRPPLLLSAPNQNRNATQAKFLSLELGFWIPIVRGIPDSLSCIPDSNTPHPGFHIQKFPGIRIPLHARATLTFSQTY